MNGTIWPAAGIMFAVVLTALVTAALLAWWLFRRLLHHWSSQPINKTFMQLYLSLRSTSLDQVLLTEQASHSGDIVLRPMGARKPIHTFDSLSLVPAQLARPPLPLDEPVDLSVEIGPAAPRPVRLQMPIFVSGMAYGLSLSRQAQLALIRGTAMAGTAINSGEGAWLPEGPVLAHRWFHQIGRGPWTHRPDLIRLADLVEIHVGQGAEMSAPLTKPADKLGPGLKRSMGIHDQSAVISSGLHWQGEPKTLRQMVHLVRSINPWCPVGVKLGATGTLEAEIVEAVDAGVDFITLDAQEAGTGNAPQPLVEGIGISFLPMVTRAVRQLERLDARGKVTLIVSGGLRQTNDFMKALALGADVTAIGTSALIAIAHGQFEGILPDPPWSLIQHGSPHAHRLDVEKGARSLYNFLSSTRKEMALMLRTMGKSSLDQLDPSDLCCDDYRLAWELGIRSSLRPFPPAEMHLAHVASAAGRINRDINRLLARRGSSATSAAAHTRLLQESRQSAPANPATRASDYVPGT